jgi:hypothetical protein
VSSTLESGSSCGLRFNFNQPVQIRSDLGKPRLRPPQICVATNQLGSWAESHGFYPLPFLSLKQLFFWQTAHHIAHSVSSPEDTNQARPTSGL